MIDRIFVFFRRERLYILLAVFVALVYATIMAPGAAQKKAVTPVAQEASIAAPAAAGGAGSEAPFMKREDLERLFRENPSVAIVLNLSSLLIVVTLLLGILIDGMLLAARSGKRSLDIRAYLPPGPVAWGVWDAVKVVILFFFFGFMLILIESVLAISVPILKDDHFRMMVNAVILDALAVFFVVYFVTVVYKERIERLGLSLKGFTKNVFYGIVGYLAAVPALMLVVIVTALIVNALQYVPEQQAVVQLFLKEKDARFLVFSSLFAALAGPVVEEIFFRGFLYNALKKYAGVFWSMLASAACFAALHAHPVGFVPILVIGMVMAYLYEKTGTLVASVTVHIIHNMCMVGFVFLLKEMKV